MPEEEATLDDIAAEISTFERRAMAAERDTVDRLIAHHLKAAWARSSTDGFPGSTKADYLSLSPPMAPTDSSLYYARGATISSMMKRIRPFPRESGLGYRLGDPVQVKLVEAVPLGRCTPLRNAERGTKDADGNALLPQGRPPRPTGAPQTAGDAAAPRQALTAGRATSGTRIGHEGNGDRHASARRSGGRQKACRPLDQGGLFGSCPACGRGRLFRAFLKSVDACDACGERMDHHRADDFPPYIVVTIVGHARARRYMMTRSRAAAYDMAATRDMGAGYACQFARPDAAGQGARHRPAVGFENARFRRSRRSALKTCFPREIFGMTPSGLAAALSHSTPKRKGVRRSGRAMRPPSCSRQIGQGHSRVDGQNATAPTSSCRTFTSSRVDAAIPRDPRLRLTGDLHPAVLRSLRAGARAGDHGGSRTRATLRPRELYEEAGISLGRTHEAKARRFRFFPIFICAIWRGPINPPGLAEAI